MANRGRRSDTEDRFDGSIDDDDVEIIIRDEDGNVVDDDDPPAFNDPVDDDHTSDPVDEDRSETDQAAQILQQRFNEMQRERDAERARATELDQRLAETETESVNNAWLAIEQAELTSAGQIETAKRLFANALAAQDFDAAADAQVKLNAAQQTADKVQNAKAQLQENFGTVDKPKPRERPAPAPAQTAPPAGQPPKFDHTNPAMVESVYKDLSAPVAAWARKHHAKLFGDSTTVFKAMNLHGVAANQLGIVPETPEYFEFMEKHLGFDSAGEPAPRRETPPPQRQQQRRRPPMAAAPSNRNGATSKPLDVTLTREQRDIAKRLGMTSQRYAKHLDTLQKGAKDPDYRGPLLTRDQQR